MAQKKQDKDMRKVLLNTRNMIEGIAKIDSNEAETRKRIDHIFSTLLGYDTFKHITQEYAIHGAGDTVHCDFAVQLQSGEPARPEFVVEIKRVNIDLVPKHIRQAASYAIDIGCEWTLLTNGKDWKLYHISFGKPPQTQLVESWNIISDDPAILTEKFSLISYRNVKKGGLIPLWEKCNVLSANNLLKVILSEGSINSIRRGLKAETGVTVTPEEIIGAIRRLLNEAALAEMEMTRIVLPEKKPRKKRVVSKRKSANDE